MPRQQYQRWRWRWRLKISAAAAKRKLSRQYENGRSCMASAKISLATSCMRLRLSSVCSHLADALNITGYRRVNRAAKYLAAKLAKPLIGSWRTGAIMKYRKPLRRPKYGWLNEAASAALAGSRLGWRWKRRLWQALSRAGGANNSAMALMAYFCVKLSGAAAGS